jgi:alpha-amylase/alpha-mannosidase (GH57 family)
MCSTINLVPSLLLQIEAYTQRHATDRYLSLSRLPADSLTENDCLFLLDHFFMANVEHMIKPHQRYWELYQRRGFGRQTARDALRRFQNRDWCDLQVWFNLTWVHPLACQRDPFLTELLHKGRGFTESDKNALLDKHLEILGQVVPLHHKLQESGQVELTTTPYFHPILPLLLDKKLAREALPDIKLPRYTGGYPEDAAVQVRRAVEQHSRIFGQAPRGMWPAEGSVCQAMIPLVAQHGIRWIATDEEILSASTHGFVSRDQRGHVRNPERMYRPYRVVEGEHELSVVFRDHALSDMIGFHYQRSNPVLAADDFVQHLRNIGQAVDSAQPALVPVILDGENCWEHYPGGGVAFLRALYERCLRTRGIRPVRLGNFLQEHPPRDTLPRLFAGSWISHNFAIWIGHDEDNTAWDLLHKAREHLKEREGHGHLDRARIEQAWEEIYRAEGSDWFWWFGDDHSSAQDTLFDFLFRKHLQNVYVLLGDAPPPELSRPIIRRTERAVHTMPRAFLFVKINGRRSFFEWINAGHYTCQNERGTMALVTPGPMKDVYFGFNLRSLLIRVDFETLARSALTEYDALRIGFVEPADYEVVVAQPASALPMPQLRKAGVPLDASDIEVGIDQTAEISIPFERLGVKTDEPIQFYVELLQNQQSRDRAPREGTIHLTCPSPDFEQIMWDV